jgi:hypothetical protein
MSDTLDIEFESNTASQYFEAYISELEAWIADAPENSRFSANFSVNAAMTAFKEKTKDLKANEESLRQIFADGKLDYEIAQRNEFYPNSIKGYHTVRNSIILSAIAGGLSYGILYMLGGPNPELYSPLLYGIAWGSGITIGSGITAIPAIRGIKKFKKASKNLERPKKLGLIERALMKSAKKKYDNLAELAMNSDLHLEKMLQGNFVYREKRTVMRNKFFFWGEKIPITRQVYSDEFQYLKSLPWLTRQKLKRVIKDINSTVEELQSSKEKLEKRKETFILQFKEARERAHAKMLAEKEASVVPNENAKDNKPHSDAPPLVEQPLNRTPGSKPKVKAVRRHKPNPNSNSSNRR